MTLESETTAIAIGARSASDEDPGDSSYGWVMLAAFTSAVLAVTFAVCVLALAGSWWMLGVAFAVDLGVTASVLKVVLGALDSSDAYPDLERTESASKAVLAQAAVGIGARRHLTPRRRSLVAHH